MTVAAVVFKGRKRTIWLRNWPLELYDTLKAADISHTP